MKSGTKRKKNRLLLFRILLLLVFIGVCVALVFFGRRFGHRAAEESIPEPDGPLVCIDPGHGGEDGGATGEHERYEKDDNLRLALAVRTALAKRNIRTVMTREEDKKVSLQGRCDIANDAGAVLFVSLHRNSADAASAGGVEIWTANRGRGARLADYIMTGLRKVGIQRDRGVQAGTSSGDDSNYYVNRHTTMPSCLVEMGFITNAEDNRLLDRHLDGYAAAIAEGVDNMLKDMEAEKAGKNET